MILDIKNIFDLTDKNILSDDFIQNHDDAVWLEGGIDLLIYIPSYMNWCYANKEKDGNLICDYTINAITGNGRAKKDNKNYNFKYLCNTEQRAMVYDFLIWCSFNLNWCDKVQIQRSLKYWNTEDFDIKYLYEQMKQIFPEENDCSSLSDFEETIGELKLFGIKTKKDLVAFLLKHKDWLIGVDQEEMDERHYKLYKEELGDEVYFDSINKGYWFCYPAFIRNALEKEFGDAYEKFANVRDGL